MKSQFLLQALRQAPGRRGLLKTPGAVLSQPSQQLPKLTWLQGSLLSGWTTSSLLGLFPFMQGQWYLYYQKIYQQIYPFPTNLPTLNTSHTSVKTISIISWPEFLNFLCPRPIWKSDKVYRLLLRTMLLNIYFLKSHDISKKANYIGTQLSKVV